MWLWSPESTCCELGSIGADVTYLNEAGLPPLAFAQLLESTALDQGAVTRFRDIMRAERTDPASLVHRGVQAPVRWFRQVYPQLDADHATELGRACAEHAQLTSFGPLSLPLVSAGSVSEIVELLTYLPLISTAVSPQFHPSDLGLAVGLTGRAGDPDLDRLVVTYCGSALLRLLELLVGDVSTMTLHLSWPAPTSLAAHEDVIDGRLTFDAPTSFLEIPALTLNEVCRFSDPVAYRHALARLQDALDDQTVIKSFAETVRNVLDDGKRLRGMRSVAEELSVSTSTLKRRLSDEGTSFHEVRDTALREHAVLSLLDPTVSVSEVAVALGYSDLSNFSHAFKRWTGQSPSHFRQVQRT